MNSNPTIQKCKKTPRCLSSSIIDRLIYNKKKECRYPPVKPTFDCILPEIYMNG